MENPFSAHVTHISYEQSACSAPGRTSRGHWPSELPDIVRLAVEHAQHNARRGEMAFTEIRFYSDEPLLQFSFGVRGIWSGKRYPGTGYAVPVDADGVEILVDGCDLAHPECPDYLRQAIALLPKGSQIRTTQPRRPDVVEKL